MRANKRFRWETLFMTAAFTTAVLLTSCGGGSPVPPASSSSSQPGSSSASSEAPAPSVPDSSSSSDSTSSSAPAADTVQWQYVKNGDNSVMLTGYDRDGVQPERVITLPDKLGGYPVTEICNNAFADAKFREVTIPASVKKIGNWAFSSNTNLTKVTVLGDAALGNMVFYFCKNLETVQLSNGVTDLGDLTFVGCLKLKSVNLPAKLKRIGNQTFSTTPLTGKIVIPEGVTSIGEDAFSSTQITEVRIPASVKTIGKSAFAGTGITSVVLPDGIKEIESGTFGGCDQLRRVYIPASVKYIDGDAFSTGVTGGFFGVALENVYYGGSQADWEKIDIAAGNEKLFSAEKRYNAKPADLQQ